MVAERQQEILVGGFVLLGLVAAAIMIAMLGSEEGVFRPRVRLRAVFANSSGLRPGAPVLLAGLNVGSVKGLSLTAEGAADGRVRVQVVLDVDRERLENIRADSMATIGSVGLLGDKSIEITVGDPSAAPIEPDALLETEEPVSLAAAAEQLEPMLHKLDSILTDVAKLSHELAAPEAPVLRSLESLDSILERIDRGEGTIGHLVASAQTGVSLDETLAEAKEAFADVRAATAELPATMAQVRRAAEDIAVISGELREAAQVLPGVAADAAVVGRNVRLASESFPAIASGAEHGVRQASEVLDAAGQSVLLRGSMPAPVQPAPLTLGREAAPRPANGAPAGGEASDGQH